MKMKKLKAVLIDFIAQFLAPCNVITQLLSESRDRRLLLSERFKLKMHLQFCQWCTDYGHQITLVDDAIKLKANASESKSDTERKLSDAARERIKTALSKDTDRLSNQ